jgi:hypothetical protein
MSPEATRFIETTTAKGADLRWNDRFDWSAALQAMKPDDWPDAMAALTDAEIRPLLRLAFVYEWAAHAFKHVPRPMKSALCQMFMPPYVGTTKLLYRGCLVGDEIGMSWTGDLDTAVKFARHAAGRGEALVAATTTDAIICHVGQFMKKRGEDEYVVDPSGLADIQTLETLPPRAARTRKLNCWGVNSVHSAFLASFRREMERLRDAERKEAAR